MKSPVVHHVNLKTTRLQELIDWYGEVIGAEPNFQFAGGAFLTNDEANHRIALIMLPGFKDDEVTTLLEKADATLAVDDRRALVATVQAHVVDALPAIPLYFRPVAVVHRDTIAGMQPTGTLTPLAWNAATWSITPKPKRE